MGANGTSRLNPPKSNIPTPERLINRSGQSAFGSATPVPDIGTITRQGKQRNGDSKMPPVAIINRRGAKL